MQDSQENYTHLYLHQDISYGPPAPCPPAIYIDRSLLHNGPTACGQTQWVAFESLAQTYVREGAYLHRLVVKKWKKVDDYCWESNGIRSSKEIFL